MPLPESRSNFMRDLTPPSNFSKKHPELSAWFLSHRPEGALSRLRKTMFSSFREFLNFLKEHNLSDIQFWYKANKKGLKIDPDLLPLVDKTVLSDEFLDALPDRDTLCGQPFISLEPFKIEGQSTGDFDTNSFSWFLRRKNCLGTLFGGSIPVSSEALSLFMGISEGCRDIFAYSRTPLVAYLSMGEKQRRRLRENEAKLLGVYQGQLEEVALQRKPFGLSFLELLDLPDPCFQWALERIENKCAYEAPFQGLLSDDMAKWRELFWINRKRFKGSDLNRSAKSLYGEYFSQDASYDHLATIRSYLGALVRFAAFPSLLVVGLGCDVMSVLMFAGATWQWHLEQSTSQAIAWSLLAAALIIFVVACIVSTKTSLVVDAAVSCSSASRDMRFFKKVPLVHDDLQKELLEPEVEV